MFSLFKKGNRGNTFDPPFFRRTNDALKKRQRQLADLLQEKSSRCSPLRLKIYFGIFCLLFFVACAFVVWDALQHKRTYSRPMHISIPSHAMAPFAADSQRLQHSPEMERIRRFENDLQLLQQTDSGRKVYDSIVRAHPGLIDSLALVKKIFHN